MKTQISTNDFKSMLKIVDKIKDKELNEATQLLVIANDDNTKFIKSNSETTIIYKTNNYIMENGQLVLPLETAELIKKLKENTLTISNEKINTSKKEISFTELENIQINTYDDIEQIFTVSEKELLRMLQGTYCIAKDEIRPILRGVNFNKNEVCTLDGYRLCLRKSKEYNNESIFTVNGNSILILKSILKDKVDKVNVFYDSKDNVVKFEVENIIIIAKCLEGEFIKYSSIIPEDYRTKSIMNAKELLEELQFISDADERNYVENLITTDDTIVIKGSQCKKVYNEKESYIKYDKKQKELDYSYNEKYTMWGKKKKNAEVKGNQFRTKQPKRKTAKFEKLYDLVPINSIISTINSVNEISKTDLYGSENYFKIAYNPRYMIDALKLYEDKVEIRMTSTISPIIVTKDGENLELMLPVRITK